MRALVPLLGLVSALGCGPAPGDPPAPPAPRAPEPARPALAPSARAVPAPPAELEGPPPDAERAPSGVAWRVLRPGPGGPRPGPRDLVTVHYAGWTSDGALFETTLPRAEGAHFPYDLGEPASFALDRVVPGWAEVLRGMTAGERRVAWIPGPLAYDGRPGRPQGMLIFDVELLDVIPEPTTPGELAPPHDATRAASGVAWRVLREGRGDRRATRTSGVRLHHSIWTRDGALVESTLRRGDPARFRLDSVIPGLAEGVEGMRPGERRRIWVPGALGYTRGDGPAGDLVIEVVLVSLLDADLAAGG